MYHIFSGRSVVRESVSCVAHVSYAATLALAAAVSVNAIAIEQAFTLPNGVACGNVRQTSAVLWAHSTAVRSATFEYSRAADFATVDCREAIAVVDPHEPVKVEIAGLIPATQYYYRFMDAQSNTVYGEFRTPPTVGMTAGLHFGASGDWQQPPPFPSWSNVATSNLDFFIKLGDSIYADSESPALAGVRQVRTLQQFRIKHDENLSSRFGVNIMASLQSSTSILATIDDHEIVDNFAGGVAPGQSPDAPDVRPLAPPLFTEAVDFVNETQVYKDAMQAFQEYHPITCKFWNVPDDARMHEKSKFYHKAAYGSDAVVLLLDTRSFRYAPLPPVNDPFDSNEVAAFMASITAKRRRCSCLSSPRGPYQSQCSAWSSRGARF
jgi:phosphodiesterase/alkaline phosphatase D-like protein